MDASLDAASPVVDLQAVEDAARSRHWTLAFPPLIERRFKSDIGPAGARRLASGMIWVILVYNFFLIGDALLIPDVLPLALALHLVVTAVLVGLVFLLRRRPTTRTRLGALTAALLLMTAQFEASVLLSANVNVNHSQYLVLMLVLFGNNILRPPFPVAIVLTAVIGIVHVGTLLAHPLMTFSAIGTMIVMLFGAGYITLVGNYQAERQTRRSYLRRLRDEIAAARLARDNVALARMARVDPLTDLENRRGLEAHVDGLLDDPAQRGCPFALLVIDVDHFKAFNDRHGHAEGDRCLKAIAEAVRAELRATDAFLGRIGGEEFVALLPSADLERGRAVAERLREAVERLAIPHSEFAASSVVTVSIGVAEDRLTEPAAVSAAFDKADAALYLAKRRGRNRVHAGPVPAEASGRARSAA